MASIFKRGKDKRRKDRPYYIAFVDERGQRRTIKGCADYAATMEIARKLESDVALRKRGVIDPSQERFAEHARRPIGEHLAEFVQRAKAEGRAKRYVQQVKARLDAFVRELEIETIRDIDADRATAFTMILRGRHLGDVTINEYVGTLKAFTRWSVATGRMPRDSLASVKKIGADRLTKKRPRRALNLDEIAALLDATPRRPLLELQTIRRGKRAGQAVARIRPETRAKAEQLGRERAVAYLLLLWTGLRRSELRALQWRDVGLDALPSYITLRAATTKAKRADRIVLHPQIADTLRAFKPKAAKPTDRVLRTVPGMKVLKADLKLAGIEFENEIGRVDLHSMRKTINTLLACYGVSQRVAQKHMRHKDPRLTAGVYTDEELLPTAAAISGLPWLPTTSAPEAETVTATGTLDAVAEPRAAHAQRSQRRNLQFDAPPCTNRDEGTEAQGKTQVADIATTCAPVQRDSQKRVMRFELTTFTLAT